MTFTQRQLEGDPERKNARKKNPLVSVELLKDKIKMILNKP